MASVHIGFDISQTGSGKAGCGYLAYAMIRAMLASAPENTYSLYPSFGDFYFDPKMPLRNPFPAKRSSYGPRHVSREAARKFWTRQDLEAALGHPDIIHSNNFWTPTQIQNSRLIYTAYDTGFAVDPTWTTDANRAGCFEGMFRSSVAADWIIAISHSTRSHYLKMFPHFDSERVRVINPCSRFTDTGQAGKRPLTVKDLAPGSFWLSVGTIEPRKNQHRLVDAYARYRAAGGLMPLVLAGGKGWLMEDFAGYIGQLGVAEHVVLTGYITDDELIWLYRNCYANIYPSIFEGFGLPVLEGMQFGAPTICSNSTSMPEVAGDAAILLSPLSIEPWTKAMLELAAHRDSRDRLATASRERASQFSWTKSARELLAIYDEAVASPKYEKIGAIMSPKHALA
jgi:glycosyltransferase involved in cell wall biosynthesis